VAKNHIGPGLGTNPSNFVPVHDSFGRGSLGGHLADLRKIEREEDDDLHTTHVHIYIPRKKDCVAFDAEK
jgi:hypothetical protein